MGVADLIQKFQFVVDSNGEKPARSDFRHSRCEIGKPFKNNDKRNASR